MSVHQIFTVSGDALFWYKRSGCVAYRGRLYFMMDVGIHSCHALLAALTNGRLSGGEIIFNSWPGGRWPVPDFIIGLRLERVGVPDDRICCFFACERVTKAISPSMYVDEINPAFKRLQRWFRTFVWKMRVNQRLQFALATRKWLQDDVVKAIGSLIK
jgi:hypothetical protein